MSARATAAALIFATGCAALAHLSQVEADEIRAETETLEERIFLPDPVALKVALMGYDGPASELLWVRAVLAFADLVDKPDPVGARWLGVMVRTVVALDPGWRTSYMYGGAMLRSLDDIDGSDAIFQEGVEHLPQDPTFPFALAMNAYLYRDDIPAAVSWMDRAASIPGAPVWYRRAAAGFYDRSGQRHAALRYLEDELKAEPEPSLRRELEAKYRDVSHDELAAQMEKAREAFRAREGRDITRPEELGSLPPDPLGGTWILAPTGELRSSVRDATLAARAQRHERKMLFSLWKSDSGTSGSAAP